MVLKYIRLGSKREVKYIGLKIKNKEEAVPVRIKSKPGECQIIIGENVIKKNNLKRRIFYKIFGKEFN